MAGYYGVNCTDEVDECLSDPCVNAVACHDLLESYSCECLQGYTGTLTLAGTWRC